MSLMEKKSIINNGNVDMPKALVDVIIPCHNYSIFVQSAIKSVQAQSLNNFRCFVVNDSSTDNSYQVIKEAIEGDARFQVFNVNFGNLSATRNFGIQQGDAPFICMVDADDEIGNENYLEVLVSELERDRTIGIAYSSITLMDENGKIGQKAGWPPEHFDAEGQYAHINQIPSMCVFRREAWERSGGFVRYYIYAQDADLWTTFIDIGYGAIHAVQDGWFHYRIHNKSQSQVHRNGTVPEPDWLEWHPGAKDGQRPFAAGGKAPRGSWPVRFYNQPEVSIIIPVGPGHEELVKDALHSVEGQTFRQWECIVVNDTGCDFDLMGFPWAKVIYTKELGAGGARNWGARYAHAPFLVFLDADDMLKPDFLTETMAAYRKHGKYAYVDWLTHDRMTNWQQHLTPEYSFEAIKAKPSIHPITCLIPKQWFQAVGGFDETLKSHEDVDLFMKLFTQGYCGVRVPKPLLIYNLASGTRRKNGDPFELQFKALLKVRYGAFMEDNKMCNCVEPPKGKQPLAPTPDNVAEYKETYGDMVLAKLVGQFVAEAPVSFRGPATRVNYGRRAKGDIFYIWQADLENSGDTFEKVENYSTEPEPTVVPPPPPAIVEESPAVFEPLPPFDAEQEHIAEPIEESVNPVAEVEQIQAAPLPKSQTVSKPKPRGKGKRK